ncbi:indoleamine 2,3-dioxygenase [Talaromyces proteolyticus]|uniref:Indoleamine 2,3-dioxygenase n=1 Tax=Talaromyces proteolyticus TaxID=1131652 RepID=A0AAD4KWM7_9EURO|nr:indoleamine 2,3-dioxygenase [Talaromyces proteolyticus]KAH8698557.1 indoleamine 2,3-dioxygenase [Talaromyces proteolyticus]
MGSTLPPAQVTPAPGLSYFTTANNAGVAVVDNNSTSIPTLFQPLTIRNVTLKNRIVVSPMCMYSAENNPSSPNIGALTDYHIAHLGHLALKGAALVFVEATAVQPNGRISPNDIGLWQHSTDSAQFKGLKRVVDFAHSQGAKVGVQLAHAGRKASMAAPWLRPADAATTSLRADADAYGWPGDIVAPSGGVDMIWGSGYHTPRSLSVAEIKELIAAFVASAITAVKAGVDVLEIHGAHGYLLTQFLSPVTNRRTDEYGGSYENRTRFAREIITAVRSAIPADMPLFLRVSSTEWLEDSPVARETGSWDVPSTLRFVKELQELGVDLVDVSSGGNNEQQKIKRVKSYQVDIAAQVRKELRAAGHKTLVGAVGYITDADQAKDIVQGADQEDEHGDVKEEAKAAEKLLSGPEPQADVVFVARQFLRDPAWVLHVANELGVNVTVPKQFGRAY